MPPKFAWPFKRIVEEQDQDQERDQERDQDRNQCHDLEQKAPQQHHHHPPSQIDLPTPDLPTPSTPPPDKERKPTPIPTVVAQDTKLTPYAFNDIVDKPPLQPAPILWTQLILRSIALTASISALAVAVVVTTGNGGRAWIPVFVNSITTTLLSTFDILSLLSTHLPRSIQCVKIPRLHPIALTVADLLVVSLSTWNFVVLFLGIWEGGEGSVVILYDVETEKAVEMWIAVGVGFIHALLFVFDCIDCCSARSLNSRVDEVSFRRKERGASRVGDDVFEMDWG
ncbi:hypothetical protein VTL71DRAFT_2481 [Oculimacula yallundae]|uniref:MARVEL domain-containing protein n=1 Tax=Oculimacula yallundae TaxID=86028 RepID=A0ABR4C932_9HELO